VEEAARMAAVAPPLTAGVKFYFHSESPSGFSGRAFYF
jgi:hypothetical protein